MLKGHSNSVDKKLLGNATSDWLFKKRIFEGSQLSDPNLFVQESIKHNDMLLKRAEVNV